MKHRKARGPNPLNTFAMAGIKFPKLQSVRATINVTQREMSEALGLSLRQYQHYEKGSKPIPFFIHYAAAFLLTIAAQGKQANHDNSSTPSP